ncbi:MAG: cbb3-type cytochrome c oxidase subunit I [Nitrososphaerota archaeon]|nr:cbb3-type cytochrome c oxidase subunit I [Nitrososphaerota archaeon]MDG6919103.1 cbb3-type cytochrome c oxidase subunit I [Nitrososphaerota archaeon]
MAFDFRKTVHRWTTTTNHKEIGILYFITSMFFGAVGAMLAELMRVQLSVPSNTVLSASLYNEFVTMHGLVMILWFLSPLGIALMNYFVPLQIGAPDLAFPRLNAVSYWMYLFSGVLAIGGLFLPGGGPNGGWTVYQPLNTSVYSPGVGISLVFLGLAMLAASVTIGSINFLVTIAHERAPGMTISKIPMFTWFATFTLILMLLAFPPLLAALVMLMSDRLLGTVIFLSVAGGAILWTNLFWFFGHPEVYIVLLPAFGAIAEILPVFAGRDLEGRRLIVLATGLMVIPLSMLVWQHHMFITGINLAELATFSVTTIIISIPFDIIVLSFILTTLGGVKLNTPMLWAYGAIVLFIIGGISGVFLSSFVLDVVFRGSYFVVAHFHYVMVGATIFGLVAGVYYWLPKITGKMYSEKLGLLHFAISFIGFNITYAPMFLLIDMPRRIVTYSASTGWGTLNYISSVGAIIFGGAQLIFVANLLYTHYGGFPSIPNPWQSLSPEWGKGGLLRSVGSAADGSYGSSESEAIEAKHTSHRPLEVSIGVAVTLVGLATSPYLAGKAVIVLGLLFLVYALLRWARDNMGDKFSLGETFGDKFPFAGVGRIKLGMWIFIASDILLFGSLIGSTLFIRENSAIAGVVWPAIGNVHDVTTGAISTVALLASSFTMVRAVMAQKAGEQRHYMIWLSSTFVLGLAFLLTEASEWYSLYLRGIWFNTSLPNGLYFLLTGVHASHVTAGLVMMVYLMVRAVRKPGPEGSKSIANFALYWDFVDIVWVFLFPLFYLV